MPTEPRHERGTSVTAADAIKAQLLLDQCHDLIGERDYEEAATAAQEAIRLVPNLPDPYVALAEAMVGMGFHQHAVEAYNEAYQRAQPEKRYEILKGRAYNRHRIGDCIGSIDDLTEMIVLQPGNAQCYIRRGITRGEIGDCQDAIEDFENAAGISGLNADLHNLLAHAHAQAAFAQLEDDPEAARELAEKALRHFDGALDVEPLHEQANEASKYCRSTYSVSGLRHRAEPPFTRGAYLV